MGNSWGHNDAKLLTIDVSADIYNAFDYCIDNGIDIISASIWTFSLITAQLICGSRLTTMKNKFNFILFMLILFLSFPAVNQVFAAESEYNIVAENFLKYLNSDKEIVSCRIIEANALDSTLAKIAIAYLADLKGGGYILVSTSKCLTPVKAYSLRHDFATLPDPYKQFLLSEMEYNIRTITTSGRTSKSVTIGETQKRWDFLLNFEKARTTLAYTPATCLLTTRWNQDYPYNKFLPEIDGQKVFAGCVNIALAQVMKYHNHPSTGTGVALNECNSEELKAILYRTYNWENMPDVLDEMQPEYKVDEVALLIRDLGIVNQTAFGIDGSTASIDTDALIENFRYSNSIDSINNSDANYDSFFNILKGEIDAERPVLLSFPGHMTVADGYSSNETGREIHVNMGWGGHDDDYYFLDRTVQAGDNTYQPNLTIYYNIKPCSETDCWINLEPEDSINGLSITGKFDYKKDKDKYEVYLKGNTTITGDRGYDNQAFYISIFDSSHTMILSSNEAISENLTAGLYTIKASVCNETGTCYSYDEHDEFIDYSVDISTEDLTEDEKTAIDNTLDIQPVINNNFRDILLNSSNQEPYRILIDARDENGDPLNLSVKNTNANAVEAVLNQNILALTPVVGASNIAGNITITASANNKTAQKSFAVMVSDQDIHFGKEFIVTGIFEDQEAFNTHEVILDGSCTITGYNGYSDQGFYSSVKETSEEIIVAPTDNAITDHTFESDIYLLCASLTNATSSYPYNQGEINQYRLTISCPDADDSIKNIANILGIDLTDAICMGDVDGNMQLDLTDAITAMQVLCGITPSALVFCGEADVNNDCRIGLAEVVYILQYLAGLRLEE
ncbi:C10 family peptidase [bacterium]|nr:C10 family peptidase [bacterium]